MFFQPEMFLSNFHYLVTGMVGIFLVIGVIMLVAALLNKVSRK